MLKQLNNTFLIVILAIISLTIISALIIQYWLGHEPCKLCLYERIPYFLSILLIIKILFIKRYEKITLLILSLVFISAILAFYHFGIEQGLFTESFVCKSENFSQTLSKEQLLEQLKQNTVSCKDVNFKVLGFSLASINTIFSIVLSVIFLKLFLKYEKN